VPPFEQGYCPRRDAVLNREWLTRNAMIMMSRPQALALLSRCDGDEIWSIDECRAHRLPETWIRDLADAFESNPAVDAETIYHHGKALNQYRGVRAVDLAVKLAHVLGVRLDPFFLQNADRHALVERIRESVEEG
jgi:hypothetical protein